MFKIKLFAICLMIIFTLSACSKDANVEKTNSVNASVAEAKPVTKDDYLGILYGYHECNGYYFYISEEDYEKKSKIDGTVDISEMIIDVDVQLSDDGVVFTISFFRGAHSDITMFCSSDGVLTDESNSKFTEISKEQFDSVTPVFADDTVAETDTPYQSDYGQTPGYDLPWYDETFDFYTLRTDLRYIDDLLAVGKESEALSAIKEKIFNKLDAEVSRLIKTREYWAAHNYVAMYNAHLSGSNTYTCGNYPFLFDYFKNKYTSNDAIYSLGKRGFSDFTQKYYLQIMKAEAADKNCLSQEECLYKLNEFFLENGFSTRSGLYKGNYMYFVDNLDRNFDTVEYYIICPYSKQIRYLPVEYYFMDIGLFYEGVLKNYL